MATSSTYTFDPTVAEFVDEAFERAGIPLAGLKIEHLRSARRSLNFMFSEWANPSRGGIKLWSVELVSQALTESDASYDCSTGTIAILEAVLRRSGNDTPVWPMSRSEYMAIPTKADEGLPTRFYFDRQRATQNLTLWQVPENSTDVLLYYRLHTLQDAGAASNTLDVGSIWYEPVAAGLAARLAEKFNYERFSTLNARAETAFNIAKSGERERVDTQFSLG